MPATHERIYLTVELNTQRAVAKAKVFDAAWSALRAPLEHEINERRGWIYVCTGSGALCGTNYDIGMIAVGAFVGWFFGIIVQSIVSNSATTKVQRKTRPIAEAAAAKQYPALDAFFDQKIAALSPTNPERN